MVAWCALKIAPFSQPVNSASEMASRNASCRMPTPRHCYRRTCLSPEFKDRGCLGDLNGQIIALTEGEKFQEAKEMIKEKTALYASTISSNTKVLASKAQQSPPVTYGHAPRAAMQTITLPAPHPLPPPLLLPSAGPL